MGHIKLITEPDEMKTSTWRDIYVKIPLHFKFKAKKKINKNFICVIVSA